MRIVEVATTSGGIQPLPLTGVLAEFVQVVEREGLSRLSTISPESESERKFFESLSDKATRAAANAALKLHFISDLKATTYPYFRVNKSGQLKVGRRAPTEKG